MPQSLTREMPFKLVYRSHVMVDLNLHQPQPSMHIKQLRIKPKHENRS